MIYIRIKIPGGEKDRQKRQRGQRPKDERHSDVALARCGGGPDNLRGYHRRHQRGQQVEQHAEGGECGAFVEVGRQFGREGEEGHGDQREHGVGQGIGQRDVYQQRDL